MAGRVQSRHGHRAMFPAHRGPALTPGTRRNTFFARRGAPVHAGPPVAAGSSGRFEIQSELDILTSNILGSESSTTLVERETASPRAAHSVTRRKPHPVVKDGRTPLGEG